MTLDLVVLIGLQASGKTTFRREKLDATHVVVSKDNFPNNRRPARRQRFLIEQALSAGRSVVVDNTNVRLEDRALLVEQARTHAARAIGYFFPSTVEQALSRNATRTGRALVPHVGIKATARALVAPSLAEGFDELYEVRIGLASFERRRYSGQHEIG